MLWSKTPAGGRCGLTLCDENAGAISRGLPTVAPRLINLALLGEQPQARHPTHTTHEGDGVDGTTRVGHSTTHVLNNYFTGGILSGHNRHL